MTEISTN